MRGALRRLYYSGVHEGMTFSFQRRVIVSNLLGMTMLFSALFIATVFLFYIGRPVVAYGSLFGGLVMSIIPWLNSKGYYNFSRLLMALFCPVAVFVLSMWGRMVAPDDLEINQYYIPRLLLMSSFCAPFILFELREWKYIVLVCAVVLVFLLGFDFWQQITGFGFADNLDHIDISTYYNINFIVIISTLITALAFIYLINVNDQYERKLLGLYEEVKDKEQDLIKAKELAEESAIAKSQFLSNMSHEIRTPLNAVIGMTNLIDSERLDGEQKENLNILRFSAENLMNIINDVLDFSKIDAGKVELEKTDFSLSKLVYRIIQSLQLKADEKGVALRMEVGEGVPPVVLGDPVRLSQIFTNLLNNALKFTEVGEVVVSMKLDRQEDDQAYIYIEVRDTGIGIAESKQRIIFESFSQADLQTTRKYGGTGLGLAITRQLLILHGAELYLASEEGKGTTFYFTLPIQVSDKKLEEDRTILSHDFKGLEGRKVLLVEDNLVNQKIASKFLEKWGVEVVLAGDGVEAIEKIQGDDYDLVLMDLQMPNMDGYEASKKIRGMGGGFKDIPIIALTASAMMEIRQRAYDAGMNDYVSKPFNPQELFRKMAGQVVG